MPSSPSSCLICGRAAELHHARHENMAMGKGMGGAWDEHDHLIPLCRDDHQAVHDKRLALEPPDEAGVVRFMKNGVACARAIQMDERGALSPESLPRQSDEWLAHQWAEAQRTGEEAVLTQALVAYGFRQRYGWEPNWYGRVADMLRDQTGVSVSVALVYDRAALGTLIASCNGHDPVQLLGLLGSTLAKRIGEVPEAERASALDEALSARDEGRRMTQVAREIAERYLRPRAERPPKCETGPHVCRYCGEEM